MQEHNLWSEQWNAKPSGKRVRKEKALITKGEMLIRK